MAKKRKKKKLEHKKSYDPINNADSMFNRQSSAKAGNLGSSGWGAKEIQAILGIEEEEPRSINDQTPLRMMDIVLQHWENDLEDSDKKKKKRKK